VSTDWITHHRVRKGAAVMTSTIALLSLLLLGTPDQDRALAAAHLKRGADAARSERYDEAIGEFKAVLQLVPSANALYNLAQCHEATGRDGEALVEFNQLIKQLETAPPDTEGSRLLETARKRAATVAGRLAAATSGPTGSEPLAGRPPGTVTPSAPPNPVESVEPARPAHLTPAPQNVFAKPAPAPPPAAPGIWQSKKWWIIGASAVLAGSAAVYLIMRPGSAAGPGACPVADSLGC
jgi:tetratricopeptide (TPR) repeat protein